MNDGTQLVRYDAMCRAIAAAHAVDEVKDIRDKARAIEMYARQAQNTEAEAQAREIRLRAERKCGQMLTDMDKLKGRPQKASTDTRLSDVGVSYDQSSQWQKLAAVPEDLFEEALREPNASTSGIIMRHEVAERGPSPAPVGDSDALWLWGRLLDFDRDGLLRRDPTELLATPMHEHMRVTIRELAPRVADWLWRLR